MGETEQIKDKNLEQLNDSEIDSEILGLFERLYKISQDKELYDEILDGLKEATYEDKVILRDDLIKKSDLLGIAYQKHIKEKKDMNIKLNIKLDEITDINNSATTSGDINMIENRK